MLAFVLRLVRPYWKWVGIAFAAMLLETAMSLASPWPLKVVLDSVLDAQPVPDALAWLVSAPQDRMGLLNLAVAGTVLIALIQAGSSYLNAYFAVSIGQWIAHDLRQSIYAHLQRLSMSYYDRQQVGPLISTITDDVNAVQDFVSTSLLDMLIDTLTIVGMLAIMLSLNVGFTLIALTVTPLLAIFVFRLRAVIKEATRDVRRRQSEIVTIVQPQQHPRRKGLCPRAVRARAAGGEELGERAGGAVCAPRPIAPWTGRHCHSCSEHGRRVVVRRAAGDDWGDDRGGARRVHHVSEPAVSADPEPRAREHEHRAGRDWPRAHQCRARRRRAARPLTTGASDERSGRACHL